MASNKCHNVLRQRVVKNSQRVAKILQLAVLTNPQCVVRKSPTRFQYSQRIDLYGLQCKGHNVLEQRVVRSYNVLPEL